MPFRSEAQRRFLYARHPKIARRWEAHTPKGANLPEYVKKAYDLNLFYPPGSLEADIERRMNLDPTRGGGSMEFATDHPSSYHRNIVDKLVKAMKHKNRVEEMTKVLESLRTRDPSTNLIIKTMFPGAGLAGPGTQWGRKRLARVIRKLRTTPEGRALAMVRYSKKYLPTRIAGALAPIAIPGVGWPWGAMVGSRVAQLLKLRGARKLVAARKWAKMAAFIDGFFDELAKTAQYTDDEDEELAESGLYGQILRVMNRLGSGADSKIVSRLRQLARTTPNVTTPV